MILNYKKIKKNKKNTKQKKNKKCMFVFISGIFFTTRWQSIKKDLIF